MVLCVSLDFKCIAEELLNLHRGQGMDLYWRDSLTCPTEEEYIDMVSNSVSYFYSYYRQTRTKQIFLRFRDRWSVSDSYPPHGGDFLTA